MFLIHVIKVINLICKICLEHPIVKTMGKLWMDKLLTTTLTKLFYYLLLVTRNYGTLFVNDFERTGEYVSYSYNKEETKGRISYPPLIFVVLMGQLLCVRDSLLIQPFF